MLASSSDEPNAYTVTKLIWAMVQNERPTSKGLVSEYGMALKIGCEETPDLAMDMNIDHESAHIIFFGEHTLRGLYDAIPQVLKAIQKQRSEDN